MNESCAPRAEKKLLVAADMLFFLLLLTEWLVKHTLVSQLVLAAFVLVVLTLAVRTKKLYLSQWFAFSIAMIAFGALTLLWAVDAPTALAMVKTLCINLIALFAAYQYFLLRRDMRRVLLLYILAAAAFLLAVVALSWPKPFETRLGMEAGVNPNDVAIIAGIAFVFALQRALGEPGEKAFARLLWLLAFVPLMGAVFFTSSLKGYALIGAGTVLYVLLRYPKHAPRNAAVLLLASCSALYLLTMEGFLARWPGVYYRITYRLQKILEYLEGGARHRSLSIIVRNKLIAAGIALIKARPLTGWGLDCFRFLPGSGGTYSHNNYIELLVSGGIPLLMLFYAPYALALKKAFSARKNSTAVRALLALVLLQFPLDWAMVSYFDRSTLLLPVLLLAGTRLAKDGGARDDLPALQKYLKNPYRVFALLASRGRLRFLPDRLFLRLVYRGRLGKKLDLDRPLRMTERIQWQKLYDRREIYKTLADKLAARGYVAERIGKEHLVPLLGVWDDAKQIDFSALPERFALKCTHDSGGVRVCADRASFDTAEAVRFLNRRLKTNYFYTAREWAYKDVQPRVLAEAFIGTDDGHLPDDFKFFCFDGHVRAVVVCTNRKKAHADYYFLTPDWRPLPVNALSREAERTGFVPEQPETYLEMLRLAETLSDGIPQVRVDLYEYRKSVLFGELTLYDQAGFDDEFVTGGDARMGAFYDETLFTNPNPRAKGRTK